MRSVIAIASAILFTAAVTGSALAATASSVHHSAQIQFDGKKGGGGGKIKKQ